MDKENLAEFPEEGLSTNPVNVTYFHVIYVYASSLNAKKLFHSK